MFIVKIQNLDTFATIEEKSFETKKEANKLKREAKKKYELIEYAGHTVNFNTRKELFTNY